MGTFSKLMCLPLNAEINLTESLTCQPNEDGDTEAEEERGKDEDKLTLAQCVQAHLDRPGDTMAVVLMYINNDKNKQTALMSVTHQDCLLCETNHGRSPTRVWELAESN